MLTDLILSAQAYGKLTIGADGMTSCYLPVCFMEIFIRKLGQTQTSFGDLCLDLQYFNDTISRTAPNYRAFKENVIYPYSTELVNSFGDILVDNLNINGIILYHTTL